MPKAFDETEKQKIRAALAVVGLKHFERAGVRAARVDDICADVGIAKGSFYSFFPSKEDLFMSVVEAREDLHQSETLAFIDTARGAPRRRAGLFFDMILNKIETDPVLNLVLANGEIAHLVRKLGPERFAAGHRKDKAFTEAAARRWSENGGGRIAASDLLGLMTIALGVATQRRYMTPEQYASTIALLRELFIDRLTRGAK